MSDPPDKSPADQLRKLLLSPAVAFAIPDDAVRADIQKRVRALADQVGALERRNRDLETIHRAYRKWPARIKELETALRGVLSLFDNERFMGVSPEINVNEWEAIRNEVLPAARAAISPEDTDD